MKRIFIFWACMCLCSLLEAQTLAPVTWEVYGLTFHAPKGAIVEEDTEDMFLLNNSQFYIEVQSMVTEELDVEMATLLQDIAEEDQLSDCSEVEHFELPHFYGAVMKGTVEEDHCYNACLKTKDTGDVFYVSIIYNNRIKETVLDKMLKSFVLE